MSTAKNKLFREALPLKLLHFPVIDDCSIRAFNFLPGMSSLYQAGRMKGMVCLPFIHIVKTGKVNLHDTVILLKGKLFQNEPDNRNYS